MKNMFPIEKTCFINNNEMSGHLIFCLQGSAGGTGAEGKPVSLSLDQKGSSYLLTPKGYIFMKWVF